MARPVIGRGSARALPAPAGGEAHLGQGEDIVSRAQEVLDHARAPRTVALPAPRIADGPQGMMPVAADHPAWAEVGRLDPPGHGSARYAIEPGLAVHLSARVIRVTAPNPGMMTGPGTNTFLVGGGPANRWAVIDPGPSLGVHLEAVMAAAPGPISQILVTHTHPDHSPGAVELAARTGAPVLGRIADHAGNQDPTFSPARQPVHGERLSIDEGVSLRVLHTPGHASNHLCFLLEEEATLFTGDHLMGASTVVIGPPDGDMSAYMASLQKLYDRDDRVFYPVFAVLVSLSLPILGVYLVFATLIAPVDPARESM